MHDLSLHMLDIIENSINAGAKRIEIMINEDLAKDILSIEIKDNGGGIDRETLEKVLDPLYTTRTTRRVGLGLSLLSQSAKEAEGDIENKLPRREQRGIQPYFFESFAASGGEFDPASRLNLKKGLEQQSTHISSIAILTGGLWGILQIQYLS